MNKIRHELSIFVFTCIYKIHADMTYGCIKLRYFNEYVFSKKNRRSSTKQTESSTPPNVGNTKISIESLYDDTLTYVSQHILFAYSYILYLILELIARSSIDIYIHHVSIMCRFSRPKLIDFVLMTHI